MFQVVDFAFGLVDLSLAITVHGEKVLVGKLARGIEAQQLAFLFLGKFDLLAERIDLLGGLSTVLQGLVHFHVLVHHGFGIVLRLPENLQQKRL